MSAEGVFNSKVHPWSARTSAGLPLRVLSPPRPVPCRPSGRPLDAAEHQARPLLRQVDCQVLSGDAGGARHLVDALPTPEIRERERESKSESGGRSDGGGRSEGGGRSGELHGVDLHTPGRCSAPRQPHPLVNPTRSPFVFNNDGSSLHAAIHNNTMVNFRMVTPWAAWAPRSDSNCNTAHRAKPRASPNPAAQTLRPRTRAQSRP